MKKIIFVIIVLVCSEFSTAQTKQAVSIFDQEIPNNPAFILLDEAPETVQRPNSSRALGITLLQDVVTDGILNDIAIEVTPFWLTSNTERSALKFYGVDEDQNQNYFSKIKQFSISAAYMKDSDSVINVSLGARTTLFEIKRKEDVVEYLDTYKDVIKNLRDKTLINKEYESIEEAPDQPDDMSDVEFKVLLMDPFFERRKAYREKRSNEQSSSISKIIKRKPAFAIDLAAAYNHRYYNNEFNNNDFGRFGVWSTLTGSFFLNKREDNTDYLNLYGFLRYLIDGDAPGVMGLNDDRFNAFDLGVKAELEFNKLSIGYEYISRSGDLEGYRSAGTIKYKALENIYLTGTFGNNFEKQDDLITLFGIQWGLNNPIQSIEISN